MHRLDRRLGHQSVGSEYVAVIPVTEHGLGLFLKDENGEVRDAHTHAHT
jgi:hypothetical protein